MRAVPAARVLIATIGSLGDLHPCLALGLELQRRGHGVTLAATEFYRAKVEGAGLGFVPLRPNWDPADTEPIRRCEKMTRGTEVLFRELILPHLRGTYEDLLAAASSTDLLIAGEIVFAAPLVAEKLGLRWASVILSPCSFLSSHDPSLLPNVAGMIHLRKAGWRVYKAAMDLCRVAMRYWWKPVRELRQEIGLKAECDPIFRDKFSPDLVLALFSKQLAKAQPDWPAQTRQPGFVFYDREPGSAELPPDAVEFLASGEPPIVFTQGSTAVHNPGHFFEASAAAASLLGQRALLIGASPELSSEGVLALRYAPYSGVFPHAAAVVHQGGSGTTGQAMRAGRPMLIVPYGWDQPDNGARVQRLGVGLSLQRSRYTAGNAAGALGRLLGDPQFAARAAEVAERLRAEDGLARACDAIEEVLGAARDMVAVGPG